MSDLPVWVTPLLRHLLGDAARSRVRERMQTSEPKVRVGMQAKGMTPEEAGPVACIRDAQFRLWKAVLGSGDLADLVRDAQDDVVVPAVVQVLPPAYTLAELVAATREVILDRTF